ncbi:MAG: tetratricopeptide repeat protein [Pseudomonadota bacterium]
MNLPLFAGADCPPVESIDRYAQTAGDALSALHELVPESQQQALEDRYAAMVMLKWQWQGRDAIREDANAMTQLLACYEKGACGIDSSDQITLQIVSRLDGVDADPTLIESLIPRQPSPRAFDWAKRILGCDAPTSTLTREDLILPEVAETQTSPTEEAVELAKAALPTSEPQRAVIEPADTAATNTLEALEAPNNVLASREEIVTETRPVLARVDAQRPAAVVDTTVSEAPEISTRALNTPYTTDETGDASALIAKATSYISSGKPSDAIAPLEQACFIQIAQSSRSSACESLFSIYTDAVISARSSKSSNAYLDLSERLCESGYTPGCNNLSRFYAAQNAPEAHRAAVFYADRACDLGSADACATVADFYLNGRASEPDPLTAREKLERSCDLGRRLSCQAVADYYLRGVGGEQDVGMAMRMIEASCPAQSTQRADLCVSAADYVLINAPADLDRSARVRTFIKRACEIGHDVGCAWYAEDLELGIGGNVDLRAARQARLTACEYGDQDSCNSRS